MSYGMNSGATGQLAGSYTGIMKNKIPKGYSMGRVNQFTPGQHQLLEQMMGHVGPNSFLSQISGGDESAFNQMEAPSLRQFSGLQGGIASRFSGQGLGGRHSSGFQNTQTAAASNFAQDLAGKRMSLKRQALMDLMGMSESLMGQRPYEQFLAKKPRTFWQSLSGNIAEGLGKKIGGSLWGGNNPLESESGGSSNSSAMSFLANILGG